MRIYSEELDRTFDEITLILSVYELEQLRDFSAHLIKDPDFGHTHILSEGFSQDNQKEITLVDIRSSHVLGGFAPRVIEVIEKDQ